MMDDQMLTEVFREAKAADLVRVPPLAKILARADYARELQRRRRFTALVVCATALTAACTAAVVFLSARPFPLSLSPSIAPLLALSVLTAIWCIGGEEDVRRNAP